MSLVFRAASGKEIAGLLRDFKEKAPNMTDAEYAACYEIIAKTPQRPTDLDQAGLKFILSHCRGGGT